MSEREREREMRERERERERERDAIRQAQIAQTHMSKTIKRKIVR